MMTADSLQLTAYGLGRIRHQKHAGAVSREPQADSPLMLRWMIGAIAESAVRRHNSTNRPRHGARLSGIFATSRRHARMAIITRGTNQGFPGRTT